MLLGVLGVPYDTIVEDYELTTIYWATPRLQALATHLAEHGVDEEQVRPLLEARTTVLQRAVEHLHDRFGDFDTYATECLGLPADFPHHLRSVLTTEPRS